MKFTQGDDIERPLQLTANDVPFSIGPAAVVRARLVHLATGATSDIVQPDGTETGSDWTNSLIVVTFPSAVSEGFTVGRSKMEVEVADPEVQTWFFYDILVLPQTIV
jgi:hypothetical protein